MNQNRNFIVESIIIGIIVSIPLSILFYHLYPLVLNFDIISYVEPYYPLLKKINYYCELYTTKNIIELGFISVILTPVVIFIIREYRECKKRK